jgi:hypothetical protein
MPVPAARDSRTATDRPGFGVCVVGAGGGWGRVERVGGVRRGSWPAGAGAPAPARTHPCAPPLGRTSLGEHEPHRQPAHAAAGDDDVGFPAALAQRRARRHPRAVLAPAAGHGAGHRGHRGRRGAWGRAGERAQDVMVGGEQGRGSGAPSASRPRRRAHGRPVHRRARLRTPWASLSGRCRPGARAGGAGGCGRAGRGTCEESPRGRRARACGWAGDRKAAIKCDLQCRAAPFPGPRASRRRSGTGRAAGSPACAPPKHLSLWRGAVEAAGRWMRGRAQATWRRRGAGQEGWGARAHLGLGPPWPGSLAPAAAVHAGPCGEGRAGVRALRAHHRGAAPQRGVCAGARAPARARWGAARVRARAGRAGWGSLSQRIVQLTWEPVSRGSPLHCFFGFGLQRARRRKATAHLAHGGGGAGGARGGDRPGASRVDADARHRGAAAPGAGRAGWGAARTGGGKEGVC